MLKRQGKKAINYATGLSFYNLLLIGVYPTISQSMVATELAMNLPNSVKRVFGVSSASELNRFESYVSTQCFGRVWLLVMGIYSISTADALITKLVDQGAMAYLLSSPVGRQEVFFTQVAVLVSGLALLMGLTVLGIWGEMTLFHIPIDVWSYFRLGILGFALFSAVGAYSLFFSVLFDVEECTILSASSLTFLCYALDVCSDLNDRFSWVKKLTIFGWVRPQEVLDGEVPTIPTLGLFGLSTIFILLAGYIFSKKDIHV
ncbi:ABC transporter permease subunit [Desulfosporosinus sp. BG]|uniref:ABC transporter permease subunit n=1 Tax=Desulfosporosinus sp. BG TaxID=1633135 RepID=UPI0008586231|nr:ABC transporter permease subunit [Desulfosporosinus sp. BG]ODA42872.1 putative ABC transporter, permease protein [Desulfosporosinus sp. BG]